MLLEKQMASGAGIAGLRGRRRELREADRIQRKHEAPPRARDCPEQEAISCEISEPKSENLAQFGRK